MNNNYLRIFTIVGLTLLGVWGVKKIISPSNAIDFNSDIRPILNRHCLRCHGGVKASGGLSFLFEEEAFQPAESGKLAIVRGKAGKSELIKRIKHSDPELRMPLDADPLSPEETQLLTDWINQGAPWAKHWAYIPPERPAVADPSTSSEFPLQNEIDHYILDRLQQEAIPPAPRADKTTLIRRLSLDLTGLPPTDGEVADFLADESDTAVDKVIDRLLDSPHFGERWAAMWMDLARYGDSQGYQKDPYRSIWRYRDWLIDAFNEDLPFDEFTIHQLAGDMERFRLWKAVADGHNRHVFRYFQSHIQNDLRNGPRQHVTEHDNPDGYGQTRDKISHFGYQLTPFLRAILIVTNHNRPQAFAVDLAQSQLNASNRGFITAQRATFLCYVDDPA